MVPWVQRCLRQAQKKINLFLVRNHDSPQWYNTIHFELKLHGFAVSPKGLILMKMYCLLINPWPLHKLATIWDSRPTILPSNKVHYRVSLEAYGTLKQSPLNRGSTLSLESSNKLHPLFDTLETLLTTPSRLSSTFEGSIDMAKLRAWPWYHVRNHDLYNGMILSTLSINSRGFAFGFPKRPHTNGDVFLTYKPIAIP